jgi:hypothetical protein
VNSTGLPRFTGYDIVAGCHQAHDTFDQVVDIAERFCLPAIAIDREVPPNNACTTKSDTTRPSLG